MHQISPSAPGVRTVLHITPAVYVAGLLAAQRSGLSLTEFLDAAISRACSDAATDNLEQAPWSRDAMSLYLQVADATPELLTGRWRVLHAKVLADESLWEPPPSRTVDEADFLEADGWRINERALKKAWPRLVSETFCT
jgi:hypothetical protein